MCRHQKKLMLQFTLLCLFINSVFCAELLPYNPVADPRAIVTIGNARFTVLTPQLIRIEYSVFGTFFDQASMAFLNRRLPVPMFTNSTTNGNLNITTSHLELIYTMGQPFSQKTLTIKSRAGFPFSWYYGKPNYGNLLGTIKSLDELDVISLNCSKIATQKVHDEYLHCEWGLISRDGWSAIDDSDNWGINSDGWWENKNTDKDDLYFFGHGQNYKQALTDYTLVGGKVAMVPKYANGIWWSRWYNYNNYDVQQIVQTYLSLAIPLDVFILDMDWHQKTGWGGYTWDTKLFPQPEATLQYLHQKLLHTGLNIHDADGIHAYEKMYASVAIALGIDPATKKDIPFAPQNASYMYALEDIVLADSERIGNDFWWIDWQQGGTAGGFDGQKQNPTIKLNQIRCTDNFRRKYPYRSITLARWGGLGTHRYQVGFSGDVRSVTWSNLAFQPYFTMTSSNVVYGFWSHDLVGPPVDHELHTRWLQWGAFSPIFRTHDRGMASGSCADSGTCAIIEIWKLPNNFFRIISSAMVKRAQLIPYIYTAQRVAYDSGMSLMRPMYYYYPEFDFAYAADPMGNFGQYFFGEDMFVAPIVSPAEKNSSMSPARIWIPPGTWFEHTTGVLITGDAFGRTVLTKKFDLSEIPVFIRAGAVIPEIPFHLGDTLGLAQREYTELILSFYPGASEGSTAIYEDDGITLDYVSGKYSWLNVSYIRTTEKFYATISKPVGSFPQFPMQRNYIIRIVNSLIPTGGYINGVPIGYSRWGGSGTWKYDGADMTVVIETPMLPTSAAITIDVTFQTGVADLSGYKGGLQHGILAKTVLDPSNSVPGSGSVAGGKLDAVASTAEELSYLSGIDPVLFLQTVKNFPTLFKEAVVEIAALRPPPALALVQIWSAPRTDNCLCGSSACLSSNPDYETLRIEGYQPHPKTPGVIPLLDYWNEINDNYATPQTINPSGYVVANFENGFIFAKQQPDTVPLSLYWSQARKDMLTVASAAGIEYAHLNNYQLINATLGYVYSKPTSYAVDVNIWGHAMELLNSAWN